jgi:zinc protease
MQKRTAPLCLALLVPGMLAGQSQTPLAQATSASHQENLFAGFETHVLENGLRVWFRHIPGAANTSVGVSIPYGSDMDPEGREETAHFVEHMLFGDHRGVSEEDIKDQVESVGGSRNGFTTSDHTFYYATLPAEFGLAGIEWLSHIIEPHEMAPEVVELNRQPVALEIRAQPRELFDHIGAILDPDWLRRPDFWKREFGLLTRQSRGYDRHRSLYAISPQDLKDFYDRYYVPEAMTLVVAGDLPGDSAMSLVQATFGQLPARAVPDAYRPTTDPGRGYRQVNWEFRPNVQYRRLFKVYDQDRDASIRMLFLSRYLSRRLSAQLRFGETKAVYGISVSPIQRGPATYFAIQAPIDEDEWDFARGVIDAELRALTEGSTPASEFEADRQAVVERLIAENRESLDLVMWLYRSFHSPGLFEDFPDLPVEFAALDQEDLAAFASELFDPEREMEYLDYPQPLTQGVFAFLVVLLGVLVMKGTATALTRPIQMRDIRYVARIRLSVPILLIGGIAYFGFGIASMRLLVAAVERAMAAWVMPFESYVYQMGAFVVVGSLALVAGVLYLSIPPRKLLVFPDHVRVKSRVYRSRVIPLEDIESVGRRRIADVARRGRLFSTLPLSLGVGPAAVHLEVRGGMGYIFRVRDPVELMEVMRELGVPVEGEEA